MKRRERGRRAVYEGSACARRPRGFWTQGMIRPCGTKQASGLLAKVAQESRTQAGEEALRQSERASARCDRIAAIGFGRRPDGVCDYVSPQCLVTPAFAGENSLVRTARSNMSILRTGRRARPRGSAPWRQTGRWTWSSAYAGRTTSIAGSGRGPCRCAYAEGPGREMDRLQHGHDD